MTQTIKTALFFTMQLQLFFFVSILFFISNIAVAADISLTLHTHSIDENVTVTVENSSKQELRIYSVYIELDGKKYNAAIQPSIPAFSTEQFSFQVKLPKLPGSYALIATVRYFNDGQILSLKHVDIFNYQETALSERQCFLEEGIIEGTEGKVLLKGDSLESWRLIVPDEVTITSTKTDVEEKIFYLNTKIPLINNKYTLFAINIDENNGKHTITVCESVLFLKGYYEKHISSHSQRGRFSNFVLITQALFSFLLSAYLILSKITETRLVRAIAKYSSRIFFISICYYLLKNLDVWLEQYLIYITYECYGNIINTWMNFLRASYFQDFFKYFIDTYVIICMLFLFPYFYFLDIDTPLSEDKYNCALNTILSISTFYKTHSLFWNKISKLGFLTIGVKLFFLPQLVSFSVNNLFSLGNIINEVNWNLYTINGYLVTFFLTIDALIFAIGYSIESKFLKNEIKSVEPTLLGWIVCLFCYNPFFPHSFYIFFDYQLLNFHCEYPQWVLITMTSIITIMWGIFAWASLSLGFKASNLTYRGIVTSGPYRFVRHPAYTAHLTIWFIEMIFFCQYSLGLFIGFVFIYYLRAWTEERHLSQDSDYLKYKSQVRWRFIPYLI